MVKNVCQPKTKATEGKASENLLFSAVIKFISFIIMFFCSINWTDEITAVIQGQFPDSKTLKVSEKFVESKNFYLIF